MAENYALNRVIGDDETGFKGNADRPYRIEGWDFIMAGGGLYNNLDYSFNAGHETGTFKMPSKTPGGGNPGFRQSMKALHEFITSFDFIHMSPVNDIQTQPENLSTRALVQPGQAYAIYVHTQAKEETSFKPNEVTLTFKLPAGQYTAQWINTRNGHVEKTETVTPSSNQTVTLTAPAFTDDVAVSLKRK